MVDGGVVDQDVEPSRQPHGRLDEGLGRAGRREVGLDEVRVVSEILCDGLAALGRAAAHDDRQTVGDQSPGDLDANAGGRPCDEGDALALNHDVLFSCRQDDLPRSAMRA